MRVLIFWLTLLLTESVFSSSNLTLKDSEYFTMPGLDVTVFSDIYPDGHQTGVTVIQHGTRVAANGDLRLEMSPGQWSPVPRSGARNVNEDRQEIGQFLAYPDPTKNGKGFNPIEYPDLRFSYEVIVKPLKGSSFEVRVNLQKPLPEKWEGKVGFNFELFPGEYFGASYHLGKQSGIFPQQPNGPMILDQGQPVTKPMGNGSTLTVAVENPLKRMQIKSMGEPLTLLDGRGNHNNGWFIVRSLITKGATKNAIHWVITPNAEPDWRYAPVMQLSQVGYLPKHPKKIIVEQDERETKFAPLTIYEITEQGLNPVFKATPKAWGNFLRFFYGVVDFSYLDKPGMYVAEYRGKHSHAFKIGSDVYARGVWQPTLEYFLPVQMCHVRVEQKYRVWHDLCHMDDARMAPTDHNHFDGYYSGPTTLTQHYPGTPLAKLNQGGWHDAGDYDLRIESQAGTTWLLAKMIEEFGIQLDSTTIDQKQRKVLMHQPDGISDAVQQVEHGLLTILGGYQTLGRLYRGIIVPTLPQYTMLGDARSQTDGMVFNPDLKPGEIKGNQSGNPDDRWVFTEDNPDRAVQTIPALAAGSRVLQSTNPSLAKLARETALELYNDYFPRANASSHKIAALVDLYLLTKDKQYLDTLLTMRDAVLSNIRESGWRLAMIKNALPSDAWNPALNEAIQQSQNEISALGNETPYGIPYKPNIWGAGWNIQQLGVAQYYFHKGWPEYATEEILLNALNFILGVHPGENTASFASGVGAHSALVAYGVNRADHSYIPGGVISGTALIRPNLPELKEWPYFWQQTEYVMGGGATHFMFLVLAADRLN